jgi:hypothetical protein
MYDFCCTPKTRPVGCVHQGLAPYPFGDTMARKNKKEKVYTGRDTLILALINGATKAGVEKDQKKEKDKRRCRDWKKEKVE